MPETSALSVKIAILGFGYPMLKSKGSVYVE
jgi:hypothetical protein